MLENLDYPLFLVTYIDGRDHKQYTGEYRARNAEVAGLMAKYPYCDAGFESTILSVEEIKNSDSASRIK